MVGFKLKRVYEPKDPGDGLRVLVDRLWPRGLSKEKAKLDFWDKNIAPSAELRRWFNHEVDKWAEFQKRYRAELDGNREEVQAFFKQIKGHPTVTLLFAAHDPEHNQAVVLRDYLQKG
jgi:Uncharacterized conserved protein